MQDFGDCFVQDKDDEPRGVYASAETRATGFKTLFRYPGTRNRLSSDVIRLGPALVLPASPRHEIQLRSVAQIKLIHSRSEMSILRTSIAPISRQIHAIRALTTSAVRSKTVVETVKDAADNVSRSSSFLRLFSHNQLTK